VILDFQHGLREALKPSFGPDRSELRAQEFASLLNMHLDISESALLNFAYSASDLRDFDAKRLAEFVGYDERTGKLRAISQEVFDEPHKSSSFESVEPDGIWMIHDGKATIYNAKIHTPEEIRAILSSRLAEESASVSIPPQYEFVKFVPNDQNQLTLATSSMSGEDAEAVIALREELLQATGRLSERYENGQSPQADLFRPILKDYREELSKAPDKINFLILYMRGSRFYSRKSLADKMIADSDPEWIGSSFDASENDDIETICDGHGLLMMQSPLGRKAVADAATFRAAPAQLDERNQALRDLAKAAKSAVDLFDDRSLEVISVLEEEDLGDQQTERLGVLKICVSGTLLTLLVGVPAIFGLGVGTVTVPWLGLLLGAGATRITYEAAKETDVVKAAKAIVVERYNEIDGAAIEYAHERYEQIVAKLSAFRIKFASTLKRVSELVPEFGWAKRLLHEAATTKPSASGEQSFVLGKHVFFVGSTSQSMAMCAYRAYPAIDSDSIRPAVPI